MAYFLLVELGGLGGGAGGAGGVLLAPELAGVALELAALPPEGAGPGV
jgi:hypothetical protein